LGLSYIRLIFDDNMDDAFARQQVFTRIGNADLPEGTAPEVKPPYGPTGEIYTVHTREAKPRTYVDLNTIQEWVLDRQFKSVPGVADVNTFSGGEKSIYEGKT
jgi:cobalt-zinc-cadmium resistance protein CzcA